MSTYLSRADAAQYLTERGLPISKNTLQKYATTGGGPDYRRWGNRAVYSPDDLNDWIDRKLSEPMASTSKGAA